MVVIGVQGIGTIKVKEDMLEVLNMIDAKGNFIVVERVTSIFNSDPKETEDNANSRKTVLNKDYIIQVFDE